MAAAVAGPRARSRWGTRLAKMWPAIVIAFLIITFFSTQAALTLGAPLRGSAVLLTALMFLAVTRSSFTGELQGASDRISAVTRADLQVMLRRAALVIRNTDGVDLDPRVEDSLSDIAVEIKMSKLDLIKTIIGDWLSANAYLPVPLLLDEDSETDGIAQQGSDVEQVGRP
ncbi:hypothetical protein [Mesorhizobium sp. LSHC412B00]|uniref:hypothetical protein n=1 Tax=Mesorhizobium sp. LSHC412B00 TaxID=1287285 RepID=UPI0003CF9195|nr:hypothetical protein [Mesorhizobium sp. LSHC412B00]ESX81585.1 hypothetical protein X756_31835 [Mesorhizobium sp. LSHC412B00]